jgi:hypothetical protein
MTNPKDLKYRFARARDNMDALSGRLKVAQIPTPFANPPPGRTMGAIWRKSTTASAAIFAVCDVVGRIVRH